MSDLAAALQIAIRAHAATVDKQGQPYLLHILRVVEAVSDEAKVVAALHDVCEDGSDDWMTVATHLGLPVGDAHALGILTRGHCTYADYIGRIARCEDIFGAGDLAREVKLADLKDNLFRIPLECNISEEGLASARRWQSLKRRYETAIRTLEDVTDDKEAA